MIGDVKIGLYFLVLLALISRVSAKDDKGSTASPTAMIEDDTDPNTYVVDVRDLPKDFKVPTELWDKILNKDPHLESEDPLIVWLPLKVDLEAKSPGILLQEKIQYRLPRGGGAIDLSKLATGDKGTFRLKIGLNEFSNPSGLKVFFLSSSKKRRIDGEVYGSGCNVFLDVTARFLKAQQAGELKFNITDNRHVSSMAGHFIFVQSEKDKVFLSQVEFTDSKNRDLLCKI